MFKKISHHKIKAGNERNFGLIFATLLTLIVTPSLLMLRENIKIWYAKKISA